MVRLVVAPAVAVALVSAACGTTAVTRPAEAPPSPASITQENPGGDAADPEKAALERLLLQPWGQRRDRWATLRVPLSDVDNWERVRLWGQPTRVAFRFGDDHYGLLAVWYQPAKSGDDPEACLQQFVGDATAIAEGFGMRIAPTQVVHASQVVRGRPRPVIIKLVEGSVESIFQTDDYVGAIASYRSWPGTCLLQGFAVTAKHRDLALAVRERWVREGAAKLSWTEWQRRAPRFESR
jgi:hypothetical protein